MCKENTTNFELQWCGSKIYNFLLDEYLSLSQDNRNYSAILATLQITSYSLGV
jgi:hypothetical protein